MTRLREEAEHSTVIIIIIIIRLREDAEHSTVIPRMKHMVKTLRQAPYMHHRDLHGLAKQGNLYLRKIKELMREFAVRVGWEWDEGTQSKGWFYSRHNKCDHVAGEVTMHEERQQARFVEWDWDYIQVDDQG